MLTDLLKTIALPPGRVIRADEGNGEPAFWLSDGPVDANTWRGLYDDPRLWPLVLIGDRPWVTGEVWHDSITAPDTHNAGKLLAGWWRDRAAIDPEEDELEPVTDPFGEDWPGLAPATPARNDPGESAGKLAERLLQTGRLGLVAAERGADALATMGWAGPVNYENDTGKIAAVLRSWEDRFGARVVGLEDHSLLHMSVANPPQDDEQALRIAAEHFALCPDNVWQGTESLRAYADELKNAHEWAFWWD
ncbi:hypothetical protein Lesp02_11340 [Lentzea sp. NBRC 105346]|uniref:DUF4253 domain-containing protein n=1 Tax=Lentzea sp. NBRC 105346 TaxID=3032205 RepID=UPI0024A423EB|nr:DUF4253 domain-containing protein [Lentzea sp. NBRC 105346]GLZ28944.1 hypothetical protein Lesp02_11340 [Lentzea sp. NBRC 105346]